MRAAEIVKLILLDVCACMVVVVAWEAWPYLRRPPAPPDELARRRRRRAQRKDAP